MATKESKELAKIIKDLGLTAASLARETGFDPRTVRNALTDSFKINPTLLKRARRLYAKHNKAAASEELQLELETPPMNEPAAATPAKADEIPSYVLPEHLKKMRGKLAWTQRQVAEFLNCGATYFNSVERGTEPVSKRYYPALQVLSAYAERGDFSQPPIAPPPPLVESHWAKKRREGLLKSSPVPRQVAPWPEVLSLDKKKDKEAGIGPEKILELNTRFQERFRDERNQRLLKEATTFIAEQFLMDPKMVREVVGTFLTILKDNMSAEEMVDLLIRA